MTDLTLQQIANAEIVPDMGGPEQWLIRTGEEEYEFVPKNARNTLLLKTDVLEEGSRSAGDYTVHMDFRADTFRLEGPSRTVQVPTESEENVLWAAYDRDEARLARLFSNLTEGRVRIGTVDYFLPRFREAREDDMLRKVEDGWLVDDEILVNWRAENYAINVEETHLVEGGGTVVADETKPARDLDFGHVPDEATIETPTGGDVDLFQQEIEFLATVEFLLEERGYIVDNGLIGDAVERAQVNAFTDTKSGLHHGHGLQKHDLSDLGVTDEAIQRLWSNSNDHTAAWEMGIREQEFKNAPFPVFEDAENDNAEKWRKIHNTQDKAPIPQSTKDQLEEMYA